MKRTTKTTDDAITAFARKCSEFDDLIAKLQALRAEHFNADPMGVDWGHVGSLGYLNDKLTEAVHHYAPEGEALWTHAYVNGKRVRVCIPGRD